MEIEVGKMYFRKKNNNGTIRLVTLILDGKVHYRTVHGPSMKRMPTGCTTAKSFQKWATGVYMGDDQYHKIDGCVIHNTFVVKNVKGEPVFRCGKKRAEFYLRKGYAKKVDDSSIQLLTPVTTNRFEQLYKEVLNPFFMSVKNDKCVVCGVDAPLTRHHVVPRRVMHLLPNKIKRRMSNILFVCIDCHKKYNENDIYTDESDPKVWLAHFNSVMHPKHMPSGWDIFMIPEGVLDEEGRPPWERIMQISGDGKTFTLPVVLPSGLTVTIAGNTSSDDPKEQEKLRKAAVELAASIEEKHQN